MNKGSKDSPTQAEIIALNEEYETFIRRLRERWLRSNNHPPKAWTLYELDEDERKRVDGVIRRWEEYITPLAERWWKKRGFGVIWPEKSSEACKIYKLESVAA